MMYNVSGNDRVLPTVDASTVSRWVKTFLDNPAAAADPLERLLGVLRRRAELLLCEGHGGVSRDLELIDLIEQVLDEVRDGTMRYHEAAEVSEWEYTTIKKKASSVNGKPPEIRSKDGRVYVAEIPIAPRKAPRLHAVAAIDKMAEAAQARQEEAEAETRRAGMQAVPAKASGSGSRRQSKAQAIKDAAVTASLAKVIGG